jgi:hypothetical protein
MYRVCPYDMYVLRDNIQSFSTQLIYTVGIHYNEYSVVTDYTLYSTVLRICISTEVKYY